VLTISLRSSSGTSIPLLLTLAFALIKLMKFPNGRFKPFY
jgi:hypothetical protein